MRSLDNYQNLVRTYFRSNRWKHKQKSELMKIYRETQKGSDKTLAADKVLFCAAVAEKVKKKSRLKFKKKKIFWIF